VSSNGDVSNGSEREEKKAYDYNFGLAPTVQGNVNYLMSSKDNGLTWTWAAMPKALEQVGMHTVLMLHSYCTNNNTNHHPHTTEHTSSSPNHTIHTTLITPPPTNTTSPHHPTNTTRSACWLLILPVRTVCTP
jgi:hypothetical protein